MTAAGQRRTWTGFPSCDLSIRAFGHLEQFYAIARHSITRLTRGANYESRSITFGPSATTNAIAYSCV